MGFTKGEVEEGEVFLGFERVSGTGLFGVESGFGTGVTVVSGFVFRVESGAVCCA